MSRRTEKLSFRQKRFQRRGGVAAFAVLMVANQFAPALMADDLGCYSATDLNCDMVVDGQDLSLVLGSWGTNSISCDLDGSCTVDGGDLAMLLGSWGALPEIPEWEPINFTDEVVSLCFEGDSVEAVLNGSVAIDPAKGNYGSIDVQLAGAVSATVQYQAAWTTITVGDSVIGFDGEDFSSMVQVNGVATESSELFERIHQDISEHGTDASAWDTQTQAMMAHALIFETPLYTTNMVNVRIGQQPGEPSFWCKMACLAAASVLAGMLAVGCSAFAAECVAGSVVTIGALIIPCSILVPACYAGTVFFPGVLYELCLERWNV